MNRHWGLAMTAAIVLVTVSACAAEVPETAVSPAPPASAQTEEPAADSPFTCADLVSAENADLALASPSAPADVTALLSYPDPDDFAVEAAGGIRCAWLADGSQGNYTKISGGPGVPWLDVQVLPGAADRWTSYTGGDMAGTQEKTPFAGFDGAHSCGDPGCRVSAPIGAAWVTIMVNDPGLGVGDGLVGASTDEVLEKLTPATAALFQAIADATPAQLAWPATPGRAASPNVEICQSFLPADTLAQAVGADSVGEYSSTSGRIGAFGEAAIDSAGFVECTAEFGSGQSDGFVLALDNAAILERIASHLGPDNPLHADTVEGQVDGETAVSTCDDTRLNCLLWFSLGTDAIFVNSLNSKAIAEAIIARAR